MKPLHIKSSQIIYNDYGALKVKQLLNMDSIPNISAAIVKLDGKNKKIINPKGDAIYYILEGSGIFNIDNEEFEVTTGDLIFIPKGTPYFDKGSLTMLSVNNPRYDADAIKYI